MRTLLEIKHYSKKGELLPDSYRGWSRSFTKKFIELLYLSHANILTGAPYTISDVIGSTNRAVDSDSYQANSALPKANMLLFGPGGYSSLPLWNGDRYTSGAALQNAPFAWVPGHVLGIQIGRSATAVTPSDTMLTDRIHHGTHGSVAGPTANLDSYLPTDTSTLNLTTTPGYVGMLYSPKRSISMTDVQFKCFRTGSPGNISAVVIAVNGGAAINLDAAVIATSNSQSANGYPSTSGTAAMETFTFASPVYLQAGFVYFIGIYPSRVDGSNYINIRGIALNTLPSVASATAAALAGVITPTTPGILYQIDGSAGAEMEYGSTDLMGATYVVSNPTAVFTVRRFFWNNSGEAITVQESGIYLPVTHFVVESIYDLQNYVVCAAHDTFAGIAVANGESIEVDYTPSIHI